MPASNQGSRGSDKTCRVTASGLLVAADVSGLVGRTPMIRLQKLESKRGARLWAKCEFRNPAGSIKDRPAWAMIDAAEREGRIGKGTTVIEATSGNTGISLAMIAAVRGYRCIVVMPEDMSFERRQILHAFGAEVVLTPAQDGMRGAVTKADQLVASTDGAIMLSQFANQANPKSHEETTALEIVEQTSESISVFVAGVGTGGTLTGVGRVLKAKYGAKVRVVAVEPAASAVLSGKPPGLHAIQGLGAGFIPEILDRSVIDDVVTVPDAAAERMMRRLAREMGLLVGVSSGANVHAAAEIARGLSDGDVVTILCDSGERYLD